jgi:putative ABC transport system permease protein
VVTRRRRVSPLDMKLLRDLLAMRGQVLAIAAVMAAGVAMFVAYFSNFDSLTRTRDAYYDSARFADVFVSVTRAPEWLRQRIAAIPGVQSADTRVVADVTIDVPGMADPATGRLVSLPVRGEPALNALYLRRGRSVDPSQPDEVVASEAFCDAHGLEPGDGIGAIVNGRWRRLTIVGVALSPEFVYAVRAGEVIPDARRYGIFWMERRSLASAFDMDGAFNDVSVALRHGASEAAVIDELDLMLARYGSRGAVPRALQTSAWTLENELAQLRMFGFITPLIFFGVAVFILHVALTRALALQRPQIAALKALGYSNGALAWHYVKWALVIAALGAAAGAGIGAWLGSGMINLYNRFFRFPELAFRLSAGVIGAAVGASLAAAALGALGAVLRAVRVPPAEAMRPEPPARYRRSRLEVRWKPLRLPFAARMVVRNLERQPLRAAVSTTGIAFAVAVLFVGLAFLDVMNALIDHQFKTTMRQDATLTLVQPRAGGVLHDVAHLPGVLDVEPMRVVPARLRAGTRWRNLAITGMVERPRLNRVVDRTLGPISLPGDGLVLSKMLGDVLGVVRGQNVDVEVLDGRRVVTAVPVVALVDDVLGLRAYMHIDALRRLLREGPTVSEISVALDPAAVARFHRAIKETPTVAGIARLEVLLESFEETMASQMLLLIVINVIFAAIIAFGVVYNSARVSLSERSRELASLRVLGFTRAEISFVLLGELALLTLAALPLGAVIGYLFGILILAGFSNEMYRLSMVVAPATVAWSCLTVIGAAAISGLLVRRRLDRLDLVAVLKTPE